MNFRNSDISVFVDTLRCKKTHRIPYLDLGIPVKSILDCIFEKPINPPLSIEENIECALRTGKDLIGGAAFYRNEGADFYIENGIDRYKGGKIQTRDDLAILKPPDDSEIFQNLEETCRLCAGTGIGVRVDIQSFFTATYLSLGYDSFFLKLYDDTEFVEELLDTFLEYNITVAKKSLEYPISVGLIDGDLAFKSGLLVSPKMLHQLWMLRMTKLLAPFKEKNIPVIYHCDGNMEELLPLLVELGIEATHPMEANANDIVATYRRYKGQICLIGNIDIHSKLVEGTVDDVWENVRYNIEQMNDGGYVVASSTAGLTKDILPKNYCAMIEAAHEYGKR